MLLFIVFGIEAQQKNLPLQNQYDIRLQRELANRDPLAHTSMRPIRENAFGVHHSNKTLIDSTSYYYNFTQKLWKENLFIIDGEDYRFTVDPLFNFRLGRDFSDTLAQMVRNTRGIRVQGDIGSNVSFETSFYETQARIPQYIVDWTAERGGAMPGEGRRKATNDNLADFGYVYGYLSYTPARWINLQLGHGKHFVGNGYRSMLLSDFAFNYPYLKASLDFGKGKWQYTHIWASLQSLDRIPVTTTPEALFKEKYGTFRYLTYKPNAAWEFGLFEGTVYKRYEENIGTTPLHYSAYIPVLGASAVVNGFAGKDNVVFGMNALYRFKKSVQLYGQIALDDPDAGKLGYQVGIKAIDAFGVSDLYLQAEYNSATAYTYATTSENRLQNYTHFGGELAHPHGGGFSEIFGTAYYEFQRAFVQLKVNSIFAKQWSGGYGKDVFFADEIPEGTKPIEETVGTNIQDLQMGYKFNVKTNMYLTVGLRNRVYAGPDDLDHSLFFYIGLRTNLNNIYFDF